jgi:hypothetical protein
MTAGPGDAPLALIEGHARPLDRFDHVGADRHDCARTVPIVIDSESGAVS